MGSLNILVITLVCVYYTRLSLGYGRRAISEESWFKWKVEFYKNYSTKTEEMERRGIWERNVESIIEFNTINESYLEGTNQFSDRTEKEVLRIVHGFNSHSDVRMQRPYNYYNSSGHIFNVPTHVDWRNEHIVTGVKDQGSCGSSWAFSATGSIEGQYAKRTGRLVSFSEQQLLDCSWGYGNKGCHGGSMVNVFRYTEDHRTEREDDYPYTGEDEMCNNRYSFGFLNTKWFVQIPSEDCALLRRAVAEIGPISVAIDASQRSFRHYSNGVYRSSNCSASQLNHAALVVGYSMEKGGYWIVKNSWGQQWGEEGYFKLAMEGNMCGVCTQASYPVV